MWTDRILFGALALLALSRLAHPSATARTIGVAVVLMAIAAEGYRYARRHPIGRALGSVAFLIGWVSSPLLALIALVVAERLTKPRTTATHDAAVVPAPPRIHGAQDSPGPAVVPVAAASDGNEVTSSDLTGFARHFLTLKAAAAAGEYTKGFDSPFVSPYGDGVIPLLVEEQGREVAVYVEAGPWDSAKVEDFLKWLALLRSSDRNELDVRVESDAPVPATARFYAGRSPAIEFELMALLQLRWVPYERFGPDNAQTLARLAQEYLGRELTPDLEGLQALDALIVEDLGSAGHPVLPATHLLAGSFFGEVLIALYGGEWVVQGDHASDISVRVTSPRGDADANVFGKIAKLVRNGIEDSTAAMAESIGEPGSGGVRSPSMLSSRGSVIIAALHGE